MRIAVVTDSHLAPATDALNANWRAVEGFIARAKVDLTIHLGDSTIDGADDPTQFQWVKQLSQQWPTPIRFVPGNHDIGDNPPKPGDAVEQPLNDQRLANYRNVLGRDYWRVDAGDWLLIGLNAQLMGSGLAAEAEQWDWLFKVASQAGQRPVLLMLHKPLCRDDMAEDVASDNYITPPARARLQEAMAMMDLRAVLSGHRHQYRDHQVAGLRHIWVPSTAFILPDTMQERIGEKLNGFGMIELRDGQMRFDLVCPQGMQRNDALDDRIYREVQNATVDWKLARR
jgi:3',5'-cyclic AMP phosphodiesterase CpdA